MTYTLRVTTGENRTAFDYDLTVTPEEMPTVVYGPIQLELQYETLNATDAHRPWPASPIEEAAVATDANYPSVPEVDAFWKHDPRPNTSFTVHATSWTCSG